MLFSTLFAVSGLAVTLGSAAAIRHHPRQDAGGLEITYAYADKPSGRPGSSQYCGVTFNVTDPTTRTSTQCEASHGPCISNSADEPAPAKPLDADHPATCADASFSFYLASDEGGIGNYSLAVAHRGGNATQAQTLRWGTTDLINSESYAGYWHYNCGGSGFCSSYVEGTVIRAPFAAAAT